MILSLSQIVVCLRLPLLRRHVWFALPVLVQLLELVDVRFLQLVQPGLELPAANLFDLLGQVPGPGRAQSLPTSTLFLKYLYESLIFQ